MIDRIYVDSKIIERRLDRVKEVDWITFNLNIIWEVVLFIKTS